MAVATQENIKEKVQSVREVVPGKSNNEVVMVLQYYDYNVERAIQAYLEDGAKAALQDWNFTGPKRNNKRKNKKKTGEKSEPTVLPLSASKEEATAVIGNTFLPNGCIVQGLVISEPGTDISSDSPNNTSSSSTQHVPDTTPALAVGKGLAALRTDPLPQRQPHNKGRTHGDSHNHYHPEYQRGSKESTSSEMITVSVTEDGHYKKPHQGLEKAVKDLHRQTTSYERLRHLLDHEIDRSYKSLKGVFEELRQGLNSREVKLMAEMSVLKKEASEMLEMRQNKAADLRRRADRSDKLKASEISELRAEIKHFVSERRNDDDLGRTTRFLYDSDHMMEEIKKFGEVVHVKSVYTTFSSSISSVTRSSESLEGTDAASSSQECQDHITSSVKLQNSQDRSHVPDKHTPSAHNGSNNEDIGLSKAKTSSSLSSAPPSHSNSSQKNDSYGSIQGPSLRHSSNNYSRGGFGGNTQGPRGRGQGRGVRGGGLGRGINSNERP